MDYYEPEEKKVQKSFAVLVGGGGAGNEVTLGH